MSRKIKNILDICFEILFIIFVLIIFVSIIYRIYEGFRIDNKIKNPSECLKINDVYYCKVD